jgi:hypothetical protein
MVSDSDPISWRWAGPAGFTSALADHGHRLLRDGELGLVNIGETLQLPPANASTFTPANTGNSRFFIGVYVPDLRGLNPCFGSRTLTLIDHPGGGRALPAGADRTGIAAAAGERNVGAISNDGDLAWRRCSAHGHKPPGIRRVTQIV